MLENYNIGAPGANDQTVQDLVQKVLSGVLGMLQLPDEITGGLSALISGSLLKNTMAAGATVMGSGTNTGMFYNWQARNAKRMAGAVGDSVRDDMRRQTYERVYRTLNPEAAEDAAGTFADKVLGSSILQLAYGAADAALGLDLSTETGNYIGMMASRQARNAIASGRGRDALRVGRGIASNFFEEGPYNKEAYGGLSQKNAALLAAHVGNDTDLSAEVLGTGGYSEERAKAASSRLRQTVKGLGEAMQPLKDVFGEDLPAAISAIEQITGKAIGTLSKDRVAQVASTLSNALVAGTVSADRLAETQGSTRSYLYSQDAMPLAWYSKDLDIAMADERMGRNSSTPFYMTDEMHRQSARALARDRSMLAIGDDYAKAYTMWQGRQEKGADTSVDAFIAAMSEKGGININNAIDLATGGSGAGRYVLEAATTDSNLFVNQTSGIGERLARQELKASEQANIRHWAMRDQVLRGALGLGWDKTGGDALADITDQALSFMEKSPALLRTTNSDERIAIISDQLKGAGYTGDIGSRAKQINQVLSRLTQSPEYNRSIETLNQIGGEEAALEKEANVQLVRNNIDKITSSVLNLQADGLLSLLKDPEILTSGGLKQIFTGIQEPVLRAMGGDTVQLAAMAARDMLNSDERTLLEQLEKGTLIENTPPYDKAKAAERKFKSEMVRMVNYSVSAEGLSNMPYNNLMDEYSATLQQLAPGNELTDQQKGALEIRASKLASAARVASIAGLENAVSSYLGDKGTTAEEQDAYYNRVYALADVLSAHDIDVERYNAELKAASSAADPEAATKKIKPVVSIGERIGMKKFEETLAATEAGYTGDKDTVRSIFKALNGTDENVNLDKDKNNFVDAQERRDYLDSQLKQATDKGDNDTAAMIRTLIQSLNDSMRGTKESGEAKDISTYAEEIISLLAGLAKTAADFVRPTGNAQGAGTDDKADIGVKSGKRKKE